MNQDIIMNMQGDRAFDRRSGKLLAAVLATSALALGCVTESDGAAPAAKPAPAVVAKAAHPAAPAVATTIYGHPRSIWAIRWEQQHPAEAAAYRRAQQARPQRSRRHWRKSAPGHVKPAAARAHSALGLNAAPGRTHAAAWLRPTVPSVPPLAAVPAVPTLAGGYSNTLPPLSEPQIRVASADLNAIGLVSPRRMRPVTDPTGSPDDVTLDFVAADINDVLKALSAQTHTNIVSGNDVKGAITVSLSHVSLDDALTMVTKLSGYQYAKVNGTYIVGTPASIQQFSGSTDSTLTTAVIPFTYADGQDLGNMIKDRYPDLKTTAGKSGSSTVGGVLVVYGPSSEIDQVKQLVASTEMALSKDLSSSRTEVYNVKYAAADDLQTILLRLVPTLIVTPGPTQGFKLQAPTTADAGATSSSSSSSAASGSGSASSASPSSTSSTIATKPTTYSLLLTGTDTDIERALAILKKIDVQPAQINFDAKITEINLNSAKNLGLTWDFTGAKTQIGEVPGSGAQATDMVYPGHILKFGIIGRTPVTNMATVGLDALFSSGDAKLLSDPNISAVDGQQAAVFIGDTINYVSSISQTSTGETVTTGTVNIGIKLYVTGKVDNDGFITMNIHPEVSTISGYLTVPGGGSLPQIASREATTTIRVKDGDTVVIGGLISEDDIKNVNKVPFFGDLPFFGALFRDVQHSHKRDEVVIFVKVTLQKPQSPAA